MKLSRILTFAAGILILGCIDKKVKNKVEGIWEPAEAVVENSKKVTYPYGPKPQGRLIFTKDLQFLEFIIDSRIPPFQSGIRGEGTDDENRRLIQGSFSLYGTYSVDEEGEFSGNLVQGSSFPNWVGNKRSSDDLKMTVKGNTMTEHFLRPDGDKVYIVWKRVK